MMRILRSCRRLVCKKTGFTFKVILLLSVFYVALKFKGNEEFYKLNFNLRFFAKYFKRPDQNLWNTISEALGVKDEETYFPICQLPKLDPFSPIVMKLVRETQPLTCKEAMFTRLERRKIIVNKTLCRERNISEVYFQTILRDPGNDFSLRLGKKQHLWQANNGGEWSNHHSIEEDFVMVIVNTTGKDPVREFHLQVFPSPQVLTRTIKKGGLLEPMQEKRLNVMMLMIDSVSHAHFQRKAGKVYQYIKEKLKSIILQGHTIVGDGTTPQATAFLTGIPEFDLPEARRGFPNSSFVDKWPFIFYDFKNHGYVTLFSEDEQAYATFNFRLHGFSVPPTDHYGRLFWLATAHQTRHHCVKNRSVHELQFQYIKDFYSAYPNTPKFSVTLLSDLSHDDVDDLGIAEEDILSFVKEIEKLGYLEKTILFVFGDHGARFSRYRNTMHGKLEERLPFFSVTLPSWFGEEHQTLYHNLLKNSEILTSHFDIHATLKHILLYPHVPLSKRFGHSLFSKLNRSRTCEEIGVEAHWCPCLSWTELNPSIPQALDIGNRVVQYINNLTSTSHELLTLCERLTLKNVTFLSLLTGSKRVQEFFGSQDIHGRVKIFDESAHHSDMLLEKQFEIHFETLPNRGLYEATVKTLSAGGIKINGEISRVDAYKDQPKCVANTHVHLLKFCFCRN